MNLTPKQIVKELDDYIIGQKEAKKAVAVALRNRYRRSQLPLTVMEEITPKNIIMKGPTGVGKTEIARRLAKLVKAPFVKVEATKYTEVGYVGRDVESMIRDLAEVSLRLVREEKMEEVEMKAKISADKKLKEAILQARKKEETDVDTINEFKLKVDSEYAAGKFENTLVEIDVADAPKPSAMEQMGGMMGFEINIGEMLSGIMPGMNRKKKLFAVKEAREILINDESNKLIDQDTLKQEAVRRAEQEGIVFIDEFDKIAIKNKTGQTEVSREGVQRDILPIVEGSSVSTKYGTIKTDYILFIAAGAFHMSKTEDLIPELQGRFPIRVELDSLKKEDFKRILTEPKHNILNQTKQLLAVDNVQLLFTDDAIDEIADLAERENDTSENIGARRLHTILEKLCEDISFNADGSFPISNVEIDKDYVVKVFKKNREGYDLKKYIL